MAAEELNGVHEARVERGGPPHPRRPGAPLRSTTTTGRPGGRALERTSLLRLEVVASAPAGVHVAATRRRAEPQAETRGLRAAGARVCEEPYLSAAFGVRRRAWLCRRWRHRQRRRRVARNGRRSGWRAYTEGQVGQVPLQHWKIKQWMESHSLS